MRRLPSLLLLPVLSWPVAPLPAWAADQPKACTAPAHPVRQTWQQHFSGANLAHDGHLTQEEAKAGYPDAAKHFDDIDVDHKGYVTENDIRAWRVMRKAAQRLGKPPEDKLRPRSAVQRTYPEFRTITVAGRQTSATSIAGTNPAVSPSGPNVSSPGPAVPSPSAPDVASPGSVR